MARQDLYLFRQRDAETQFSCSLYLIPFKDFLPRDGTVVDEVLQERQPYRVDGDTVSPARPLRSPAVLKFGLRRTRSPFTGLQWSGLIAA